MAEDIAPALPDELAAATVEQVESYLDQSPLQRYVSDLSRRVERLERHANEPKDND